MHDRSGLTETKSPQLVTFDAILPAAMAVRAEEGLSKRNPALRTGFIAQRWLQRFRTRRLWGRLGASLSP
jgi:hypothetical protein